jgi:hypothetical protein
MELCVANGFVVIALPNFLGLNGTIQKLFDSDNLSVHNLRSMQISYLRQTLESLNINKYSIEYYGNFGLWLEKIESRSIFLKLLISIAILIRPLLRIMKINNRLFSPYIAIVIKNE